MSGDRIIESTVPVAFAGQRLDLYLAKRFSYMSRTAWQREIESGRIKLNGGIMLNVKKRLVEGDRIEYNPESLEEPEVDFNYSIIFENENYLAVSKSGNLPVHPSGIFFHNTLVMSLEERYGMKFYPVHRLDRETSGAILFSKSPEAASAVQRNFSGVTKEYIAVTRGVIDKDFSVDIPIGPARRSLVKKKREAYPGAEEESLTHFEMATSYGEFSLVKAVPVTGRMHQIRVHLKYAGYPILGDKMYSDDETIYIDYVNQGNTDKIIQRAGFHRCALHSSSLTYYDPYMKKEITVSAGIPDDIRNLLRDLRFNYGNCKYLN